MHFFPNLFAEDKSVYIKAENTSTLLFILNEERDKINNDEFR